MLHILPTVLVLLLSILSTSAHSHVDEIWAPYPSVHYNGWNPNDYDTTPYPNNTPGWVHHLSPRPTRLITKTQQYTTARGGDPLYPISLNTPSIICNNASSPANLSAPIAVGATVRLKWWNPGPWPSNHKGPVIDYIAACNGSCSAVNAEKLKFVKISEMGWIDGSMEDGYWASDVLLEDDSSWNVTVPRGLVEGEYVLRSEIIVSALPTSS
jgi:cellulase